MKLDDLKLFCLELRVAVITDDDALIVYSEGAVSRSASGAMGEGEVPVIEDDDQAVLDHSESFRVRWRDGTEVTIAPEPFEWVRGSAPLLARKLAADLQRDVDVYFFPDAKLIRVGSELGKHRLSSIEPLTATIPSGQVKLLFGRCSHCEGRFIGRS